MHIGMHKTGTTSIQRAISQNYLQLKQLGIVSPESGVYPTIRAHHDIAWSLFDLPPFYYHPERGTYIDLVQEIRQSSATQFLISSEEFCSLSEAGVQKLRDALGDDIHVTIIIYLRNPEQWIPSVWGQGIRLGKRSETLSKCIKDLSEDYLYNLVHLWSRYFKKDNVCVRIFDEVIQHPGLMEDFWNAIEISSDDSASFAVPSNENVSPSYVLTDLIYHVNQRIDFQKPTIINRSLIPQYHRWLWQFGPHLEEKYGKIKPILSQEEHELIRQKFDSQNKRIAQEFLGRDELFPHNDTTYPISVENSISITQDDLFDLLGFIGEQAITYENSVHAKLANYEQIISQQNESGQPALAEQSFGPMIRYGYAYANLKRSRFFQITSKVINFWQIKKTTRLIKTGRLAVPQLFDTTWYLSTYPEVRQSGMHSYVHFHLFGWYQGYQPMPLFDVNWYISQYHDFNAEGMNPLEHYEKVGQYRGYLPCPLFDPQWYLATYNDVKQADVDPLYHYCYTGWREGRNPSAAFNTNEYIKQNPEVAATETNPLAHYLQSAHFSQKVNSFTSN